MSLLQVNDHALAGTIHLGSCCLDHPGRVQPGGPGAQLHEHREQLGRERVEQRGPMREVDARVRPMVGGHHDLAVLPYPEHQGEQKDQSGRQQSDLGAKCQCIARLGLGGWPVSHA
jgi:hypothetical protein